MAESIPNFFSRIPKKARHLVLLFAVSYAAFFLALGRMPFFEPDEGRNAEVARETLTTGRWLVPHYDTLVYLDKPSFYFWMVAGSFKTFGLSEAAGRLPSALAALATLLLTWILARRMFDEAAALRAGLVFATAPLAIAFARIVIFDMTFTFFVTLAMACYWIFDTSPARPRWLELMMFAALGLATFTKGPVAFAVPLLSLVVYQALRRRLGELKKLHWASGIAVMAACVLPWFVAVSLRHPDFPKYALWNESLLRFATGSSHRAGSVFYYIPIYLGGFFPWSLFLLFAALNRLGKWKKLRRETHAAALYLLCWAGVTFVFFSISGSKLPGYFLPAIVPLSVLTGMAWKRSGGETAARPSDWLTAGFAAFITLGLGVILAAEFLHYGVLTGHWLKKVPPDVQTLLRPCLITSGIVLAALGWLGRDLAVRAREKAPTALMFALVALTGPLLAIRWAPAIARYGDDLSSRRLARTILESPERNLPVYGYYYFRPGLPFYLRRPVMLITQGGGELTSNYIAERWQKELRRQSRPAFTAGMAKSGPDNQSVGAGNSVLITGTAWRARVGASPMLVIARNDQVNALAASAETLTPLWSGWDYSVWEISEKRR